MATDQIPTFAELLRQAEHDDALRRDLERLLATATNTDDQREPQRVAVGS